MMKSRLRVIRMMGAKSEMYYISDFRYLLGVKQDKLNDDVREFFC